MSTFLSKVAKQFFERMHSPFLEEGHNDDDEDVLPLFIDDRTYTFDYDVENILQDFEQETIRKNNRSKNKNWLRRVYQFIMRIFQKR